MYIMLMDCIENEPIPYIETDAIVYETNALMA